MWICFRSTSVLDNESKIREDPHDQTISFSVSTQLKDVTVRIVHAGGRVETYESAIPASKLIQKYPGTCVARPSVFKRPHDSVLSGDDILLPGNKYFIVQSTTVEKLKRRHSGKERMNETSTAAAKCDNELILESKGIEDVGDDRSVESVCSSKDFVVSKDSWSILRKHLKKKKAFVPPIQRPRIWKEPEWEPSLTSIQEDSCTR